MSATLLPMATYVIVANPATYKFVRGILGNWVADANGVATMAGLVLHAFVYVLLTGLVLMLVMPKSSGFDMEQAKTTVSNSLTNMASMLTPKESGYDDDSSSPSPMYSSSPMPIFGLNA